MIRYNTLVVLLGVGLLGAAAGPVGSFAVLRRRALAGDALAHATLPGLCLAFLLVGERDLLFLLLGALASGFAGVAVLAAMGRYSRIKEDAAVGVVLSVFFGAGIALSRLVQNRTTHGSKAGLDSFILGKTAGILMADVLLVAALAVLCLGVLALLYKEFRLVSFDRDFAAVQGWPAARLDLLLLALVAVVVVVGLPAVGAVLVAALLIMPGVTARLWTDRLGTMLVLSCLVGGGTGLIGAALSAHLDRLPAGPVIVLVGTALFALSSLVAPGRGLLARWRESRRVARAARRERELADSYDSGASTAPAAVEAARRRRLWRALLDRHPELAHLARPLEGLAVEDVLPPGLVAELEAG